MVRKIEVRGIPRGQPRPRACIRGTRAGVYDPGTARGWKDEIIRAARAEPADPFEGPLVFHATIMILRPKKRAARPYPTARPDLDNYLKAIMDALTEARVWIDDAQVVSIRAHKLFSDAPGASILIEELVS